MCVVGLFDLVLRKVLFYSTVISGLLPRNGVVERSNYSQHEEETEDCGLV